MSANDFDIETAFLASEILEEAWSGPVRVAQGEILKSGRFAKVYRFTFAEAPAGAPTSIVAKRILVRGGTGSRLEDQVGPQQRFRNECAGLSLLSGMEQTRSLAPSFIGSRQDAGIVVMDDVGDHVSLDQLLLGPDPDAAGKALLEMCVTLARLHAGTAGRRQAHERIASAVGPAVVSPAPDEQCKLILEATRGIAVTLGVKAPAGLDEEIQGLQPFLAGEGPFLGLLHNDACPDNFVTTDAGMKVWDFGFSSFGQFLVDGVYARMLFPSCWCVNRIPESVLHEMEIAYRQEVVTVIPEAADEQLYGQRVVEACAYLVTDMLLQGLPDATRRWGTGTMGQRFVSRFEAFANGAAQFGHMTTTGELFRHMAAALRKRWSGMDLDLPLFPAFDGKT